MVMTGVFYSFLLLLPPGKIKLLLLLSLSVLLSDNLFDLNDRELKNGCLVINRLLSWVLCIKFEVHLPNSLNIII